MRALVDKNKKKTESKGIIFLPEELVIFIPFNVPSSKNSRGINHDTGHTFPSKTMQLWSRLTKKSWKEGRSYFQLLSFDLKKPILIGIHFVRGQKRLYDWVNPVQTILDEMVRWEWIEDDNSDVLYPFPFMINGKYDTYDPKNPGVYIKIIRNDL